MDNYNEDEAENVFSVEDLQTHRNLSRMCDLADVNVQFSYDDVFAERILEQRIERQEMPAPLSLPTSHADLETEIKPAPSSSYLDGNDVGTIKTRRGPRQSTRRVSAYFETVEVMEGGVVVKKSRCLMEGCRFTFSGTDIRPRKYHLIICPKQPLSLRQYYFSTSSAKGKPPLLKDPPPGMTVQEVIKYAKSLKNKDLTSFCSNLINPVLLTSDTIFSAFGDASNLPTEGAREVSERQQEIFNLLLTRLLINNSLPFSFVDRRKNEPVSGLAQLLKFIRPAISLPSSSFIKRKLIPQYHELVKTRVMNELKTSLAEGYATLMFDSTEDVNQSPVTHFLVRVMVGPRLSIKTFFLSSVYSGTNKTTAEYYRNKALEVVSKWFDIRRLAGVVTDNTGNAKNARESIMNSTYGVVASQDQAHVADLLMEDIGDIEWIAETLDSIVTISVYIRRFRKVKERVNQLIQAHVSRSVDTASPRTTFLLTEELFRAQLGVEPDEESSMEMSRRGSLMRLGEEGYADLQSVVNSLSNEDGNDNEESHSAGASHYAPEITGRPKQMKRLSKVRFASAEKLLLEFRSLIPVLKVLVEEPGFEDLFSNNSAEEKKQLFEQLIFPVSDRQLEKKAEQAHAILHACRTYLRVFDGECALVSEVYHATIILEAILTRLPLDNFPEPKSQNRDHLLQVFKNRKVGGVPGRRRVKITLLSDLHHASCLMDPNRCPVVIEDEQRAALRRHITKFLSGGDVNTAGVGLMRFVDEMMSEYEDMRCQWRSESLLITDMTSTGNTAEMKKRYKSNPLKHWISGREADPEQITSELQQRAQWELRNYAKRILCVNPTATATER